jgi:hypothetical protein
VEETNLKNSKNGHSLELTNASLSSCCRLAAGPAKFTSNCCFEAATRRRALAEPETLLRAVDVEVVDDDDDDDDNDVDVVVFDEDVEEVVEDDDFVVIVERERRRRQN